METKNNLEGLGGWLILVGLSVLTYPVFSFFNLHAYIPFLSAPGQWDLLTNPANEEYDALYSTFVFAKLSVTAILLGISATLAWAFLSKKRIFPKMFIAILLAAPVVALVDAKIVNHFFPDEEVFSRDIIEELLNYIFGIVVWIPYLLVSKRVAITFTK
jgi:hypothetical protein